MFCWRLYRYNSKPIPAEVKRSTSPSLTLISTVTGCRRSFSWHLTHCRAQLTQTRTTRLQTTAAMCWPSMATRNTSASSSRSSQGRIPAPLQSPPLRAGESPDPDLDPAPAPAPILGPGRILGRMGPDLKRLTEPWALTSTISLTGWDCGWRGWWREPCPDYGCLHGPP